MLLRPIKWSKSLVRNYEELSIFLRLILNAILKPKNKNFDRLVVEYDIDVLGSWNDQGKEGRVH